MKHSTSVELMKFLSQVAQRLGVGGNTFVVGGAPRNFMLDPTGLKYPVKDIDVVIDSSKHPGKNSIWFAQELQKQIPTQTNLVTNNYGVAILSILGDWQLAGESLKGEVLEIANARSESYTEGGYKPTVVEDADIFTDIMRRDFRLNTLLWRLQDLASGPDRDSILDLTGFGKADVEQKLLKTPVNPDKTFADDPSRMIRLVRFLIKYGFQVDSEVEASVKRNVQKIRNIPAGHLSNMLIGTLFSGSRGKRALKEMDRLGMLDVIRDIARTDKSFQQALAHWAEKEASVEFLFDLMDLGMPVGKRLGFLSPDQKNRVREITVQMDAKSADEFLQLLEQPGKLLDMSALIVEFGLQRAEIRKLVEAARGALLDDPVLAGSSKRWTDKVRRHMTNSPLKTASLDLIKVVSRYLGVPVKPKTYQVLSKQEWALRIPETEVDRLLVE